MPILRACSPALALALTGGVELFRADLFTFTLADGVTNLHFTSWDRDLLEGGTGITYLSRNPWLQRSKWNVTSSMEVANLTIKLMALNAGFNGGSNIKLQIHNGLFDGATFALSRAFMLTPGDTSTLGALDLFGGVVAGIDLTGSVAQIAIKSKINKLDQNTPRNLYQAGCNHTFCDAGCTLPRASFTSAYTVGASPAPSTVFVPWSVAPANPARYVGGTAAFSSGAASGMRRTIAAADATGLSFAYPLNTVPATGDNFTAFEGCDKTFDSGGLRSCTARSNTQNYRGFEYIPPPDTAY
jgi:uncharacterized phage protein (TIGR02218 family)